MVALSHPQLGMWPETQACALTGNQTLDPMVHRPAPNPLSHTSQGKCLLFLPPCDLPSSPLKPHAHILFFSSGHHINLHCLIAWGPQVLDLLYSTYNICFSPGNLSYVNLIITQAREPKQEKKRKVFCPYTVYFKSNYFCLEKC